MAFGNTPNKTARAAKANTTAEQHTTTPNETFVTNLVPLEAGDHDGAVRAGVRREAGLEQAVEKLESHLPLAAVGAGSIFQKLQR